MRKVNFWTITGMWKRMRSYPFIFLPSYHHHHHLSPINGVFKDLIKYHIISQWNVRKRFFSVFSVYVALFLLILPRRPGGHGHLYTCISDALLGYHGQCSFSSLAYPRKLWRWFFFSVESRPVSVCLLLQFSFISSTLSYIYDNSTESVRKSFFFRLII